MQARMWFPVLIVSTLLGTVVAQDAHRAAGLRGKVTDENGAAITVASVLVHPDRHLPHTPPTPDFGEDVRLEVNQKGEFSARLAPGLYDVVAFAHVFSPQCAKVRITEGGAEEHNFVLHAEPVAQEIDY